MITDEEKRKYEVINQIEQKLKTRKEGSIELNLTLKQIDRLRIVYRKEGVQGFIHKNRGKNNPNKIEKSLINELEKLYLEEYYDFNFEAFYEKISNKYNISYSAIFNTFKEDDIISPLAHKKTIKAYNEKMKNAREENNEKIAEEKIELYNSRIIAFEKAHTRKSNLFGFGQEVQMDACEKKWFGGIVSYLHLAVDKGTKKVLFGWFEWEEITRGYFVLLYNLIINYGIPARIKTDNRNSFSNKENKVDTTQFGMICNMLNIELITTSVSTAKAHVERENLTFKNRLIAELRHEGITNIDDANYFLNNIFIPEMNKRFSYVIDEKTSKMRKNNYSEEELSLIISEKYKRIIDNASSIRYDSNFYLPINPETGEVTCFIKGTECEFIITYNGDYWCKIENNYYQLIKLENRDLIMKKESEVETIKKEHHKYIPPKNHPWRKNMMLEH